MRMSSCFFSSRLKIRISLTLGTQKAIENGIAEGAGSAGNQKYLVFEHGSASWHGGHLGGMSAESAHSGDELGP